MSYRLSRIVLAFAAIVTAREAALVRADDDPILRFAPDGSDFLFAMDVTGISDGPAAAAFFKRHPDLEAKLDVPLPAFGLAPRALKQVYVVGKLSTQSFLTVGRLGVNVTAVQAFPGSSQGTQIARLESRRLGIPGHSGVVVDGHPTVRGPTEFLRAVLDRNGPARISEQMLALRRAVPNNREVWVVVEPSPVDTIFRSVPGKARFNFDRYLAKTKWMVATIDFEERLVFRSSVECVDAATVGLLVQDINVAFREEAINPKTPASFIASLREFKATPDGTNLSMRVEIPVDALLEVVPLDELFRSTEK